MSRRRRKDKRLAWTFHEHRKSINDVRIAFTWRCRLEAYRLSWLSDEEIAGYREHARVDDHSYPVRPDAFFAIDLGDSGPRAAFFLELQRVSDPSKFRPKAQTYMAYQASGAYTARFGHRSLRILTVADTAKRAANLKEAAEQAGGATLFWSAALPDVQADPFGPIWCVAGIAGRRRLFEDIADCPRMTESRQQREIESTGSAFGPSQRERTSDQDSERTSVRTPSWTEMPTISLWGSPRGKQGAGAEADMRQERVRWETEGRYQSAATRSAKGTMQESMQQDQMPVGINVVYRGWRTPHYNRRIP